MDLIENVNYRERTTGRQVLLTHVTDLPTGDQWVVFTKTGTGQQFTIPSEQFKRDFEAYTD